MRRLEEASREIEMRAGALAAELDETKRRIDELRTAVALGDEQLGSDIRALDELRAAVASADDAVSTLRISADQLEAAIRVARGEFEAIRTTVAEFDVARATAESDHGLKMLIKNINLRVSDRSSNRDR